MNAVAGVVEEWGQVQVPRGHKLMHALLSLLKKPARGALANRSGREGGGGDGGRKGKGEKRGGEGERAREGGIWDRTAW